MLGRSSFVFGLGSIVNFLCLLFTQLVANHSREVFESCKITYFYSSLFNKKRSSDHIFGKIGFTSNVLLSEDDYVPHLMKMCFTLLWVNSLSSWSLSLLLPLFICFLFVILFYDRIVSPLLSSLLEPFNGNIFPIPCLVSSLAICGWENHNVNVIISR